MVPQTPFIYNRYMYEWGDTDFTRRQAFLLHTSKGIVSLYRQILAFICTLVTEESTTIKVPFCLLTK